ncbi:hypothetical protein L484_015978 [Morus notabilis]|uniref:Uncharacterized protein n=1 Tax=Morus notabilis TaxID=981085 RepID=W9SFM6_9ROSA|nr:hypothetical protein L484_015978 [Morus notabilis]
MAAQVSSSSRTFFVFSALLIVFAAAASTVSAQDFAPAPAPIPTAPAYSFPVSGAVVGASLALSLLAFLKH